MNQETMWNHCPTGEVVSVARLEKHQLIFNRQGIATVIENESATVYGVLYRITDIDLVSLDKYENYPDLYDCTAMKVTLEQEVTLDQLDEPHQVHAIVYLAKDSSIGTPQQNHLLKIIEGASKNRLPEPYILKLERLL